MNWQTWVASFVASGAVLACASTPASMAPETPANAVAAAPQPAVPVAPTTPPPALYQSPLPEADPDNLPSADCAAYRHPQPPAAAAECDAGTDSLDAALSLGDPLARDAALAQLQSCNNWPPGWVVGLRAELAPVECADDLIGAWFVEWGNRSARPQLRVDLQDALVGLSVAARLRRLDVTPPALPEPNNKPNFLNYFEHALKPWVLERAQKIHSLSLVGSGLLGYGRGVAAVEAAVADLRFVEMARGIDLPQDMQADAEVKQAYFAALDEALEPRKLRARDAALVGFDEFAQLGVLTSQRVDRARDVLARSYAGQRVNALDGLELPALPALSGETVRLRLAARLPPFFAADALGAIDAQNTALLRALLEQGYSPNARAALDAAALPRDCAQLYARYWVAVAQRYFRLGDFARAAQLVAGGPAEPVAAAAVETQSDSARLIAALASALAAGPSNARAMFAGGPLLPQGVGNVQALDTLSEQPGQLGALAAYDAAYVLALLPPLDEPRRFWNGIADRYSLAAKKFKDPAAVTQAKAAAHSARQTARAVAR